MQKNAYDIVIFLIVVSGLIITMIIFIISVINLYRKKQILFSEQIQALTLHHEKEILDTRLEIQEQTFQHISREIHDNINLSLTLAKLNLNTIDIDKSEEYCPKIQSSIELLTKSIKDLGDISKTLNSDLIIQQGLVEALTNEIKRIEQAGNLDIEFAIDGEVIFLKAKYELIIFRIIQEAFNNIIKHAEASKCKLNLYFNTPFLIFTIGDNGKGFLQSKQILKSNAGLKNMQIRAEMLGGTMEIKSELGRGTILEFNIPY